MSEKSEEQLHFQMGYYHKQIDGLCINFRLTFDREALQQEMDKVKRIFRDEIAKELISNEQKKIIKKVESLLLLYNPQISGGVLCNKNHIYEKGRIFVEWVFDEEGNPVEEISSLDSPYWILLNKSPFFPGTSSIISDNGSIELENNCCIKVVSVQRLPSGWILHQLRDIPEIGFSRKTKVISFNIDNDTCLNRTTSLESMAQLKHWFKDNYDVVRFNDEFINANQINVELTILAGELTLAEIKKCENHLLSCELPVITKRNWKQSGVYDLTCATGSAAFNSQKFGHEVFKHIMGLKEIITKQKINYIIFRDIIIKQIDIMSKCLSIENIPLPYEIYVKAEKIITDAEFFLEKQDVLAETIRLFGQLEQLDNLENPFVSEFFQSDAEFTSLGKLTGVTSSA